MPRLTVIWPPPSNAIESAPIYAQPKGRMDTATLPRNFYLQKAQEVAVDEGFSSNSANSSQSSNDYAPAKRDTSVTRGVLGQQKSVDEGAIRVHPDYTAASLSRKAKVPVGAMFDERRFSTLEPRERVFRKNGPPPQIHDGYSTMPSDAVRRGSENGAEWAVCKLVIPSESPRVATLLPLLLTNAFL
ncbi:unnamed protein product, partial [Mesorhabditis spiculigera]